MSKAEAMKVFSCFSRFSAFQISRQNVDLVLTLLSTNYRTADQLKFQAYNLSFEIHG